MIIMDEEIHHLIDDDENVLWTYSQKYKYLKSTIKKLNFYRGFSSLLS